MRNVSGFTLADQQRNIAQSQFAAITIVSKLIVLSGIGHVRLALRSKVSLARLEIRSIAAMGKLLVILVDNHDGWVKTGHLSRLAQSVKCLTAKR